ncbi:hypothetical protein EDF46_0482 [Frondihabitans sp. PhB188]|nr:hypothetical protein [Frondihabitans sp. PhB188]ROQ41111.1 hypothetical protein EDF46_0482 [Frondihabitans sp. PhB188]
MTTPGAGTARRRPSLVVVLIGVGLRRCAASHEPQLAGAAA